MIERIRQWLVHNEGHIAETYRHLHSIAEVSWQERETTAYIDQSLRKYGLPSRTFEPYTGVVSEWSGVAKGTVVALRADLDALWQRVNGQWKANHSCGHDAHATMVLMALKCLFDIGFQPAGQLMALFQPAEEIGEGAKKMIELGVMDDVRYLLGIHLRPVQELAFGQVSNAIYHGAAVFLHGTVEGRSAHASRPNLGINAADALAGIVHAVNAVKVDPMVPSSCKITRLRTNGDPVNIIADSGEFAIDVRAQTNGEMEQLLKKIDCAVHAAGSANGAKIKMREGNRMAAATPSRLMETIVKESIIESLGEFAYSEPPVTPGGEDFYFYPLLRPNVHATMIGLGCGLTPGLHHPDMSFQLESLHMGVSVLATSVVKLFAFDVSDYKEREQ